LQPTSKKQIFIAGHAVIDHVRHRSDDPFRSQLGGSVSYDSIALKSLGARFKVCTRIGFDFPDEYLRELKQFAGVDFGSFRTKQYRTTSYRIDRSTEPRKMWLAAFCAPISSISLGKNRKSVKQKSAFLLAVPIAGEISLGALKEASAKFQKTFVDSQGFIRNFEPKTRKVITKFQNYDLSCLDHVDYLKADRDELQGWTGKKDIENSIAELSRHVKHLLVSSGSGALVLYEGNFPKFLAMPPRVVVKDSTGAGDILLATLAAYLAAGESDKEALRYAVAAASLSVQSRGITKAILDRKEVEGVARKIRLKEY
jgi:sugar/nucleoside kinase (ribokinase family)